MTSNIRFTNPQDDQFNWPHRKSLWSGLITKYDIDILGTQEGREPQLREAEELLPSYTLVDSHRPWIKERMYPCIFIKTENFNVIRSGDIWLSENPYTPGSISFESAFPRLSTFAELECKRSNKKIFVINCHLDHMKNETRAKQIQVLLNELKVNNPENLPIILMGDFNESFGGEVRKLINSDGNNLQDSWTSAEEGSHHRFTGKNQDTARIDWIMHSPSLKSEDTALVKDSKGDIYPSDHFPVKTTITI